MTRVLFPSGEFPRWAEFLAAVDSGLALMSRFGFLCLVKLAVLSLEDSMSTIGERNTSYVKFVSCLRMASP